MTVFCVIERGVDEEDATLLLPASCYHDDALRRRRLPPPLLYGRVSIDASCRDQHLFFCAIFSTIVAYIIKWIRIHRAKQMSGNTTVKIVKNDKK
jgi:hypothetical protein